jgi:hypothetical protein
MNVHIEVLIQNVYNRHYYEYIYELTRIYV